MCRRFLLSALVVGTLVGLALAESAVTSTNFHIRRQDPNSPSSSPVNWWPYPAYSQWGDPSASPAAAVASPTPMQTVTSLNAAVGPSIDIISSPPALSVASTSSLPSSASSSQQTATTSSSASITTITALPPATSPSRYKPSAATAFHVVYLTPIFALIGAIFGAVITWFLLQYIGRRNKRASALKPGPAYAPTSANDDASSTGEHTSVEHFLGGERVRARSSLLSRATSNKSNWLVRALSSHRREPAALASTPDPETGNASNTVPQEDDPFLVPPGFAHTSRGRSLASTMPARFELLRSPDALSEDEELDNAPYETLRHKSIRRGILERLQEGPQHRRGHTRTDSDVTIEALHGQSKSLTVPSFGNESPLRGRSSSGGRTTTELITPQSSGPGFRIVQEDPEDDTRSSLLSAGWRSPWSSPGKRVVQDNFTAIPERRSAAERRSPSPSPSHTRLVDHDASPSKARYPIEKFPFKRVDSSVLPSSPPQVSSPPLDAQLFFRSISPGFESAPILELGLSPAPSGAIIHATTSPSAGKLHNKLHTHRLPPALSFPSSDDYTNRLKKTHYKRPSPENLPGRVSPGPTVAQSPAEQFVKRHGALAKVEQILEQSWSARELRGDDRVRSPTMFGAVS